MLFTFMFALQEKMLQSMPPSTVPHHSMSHKAVVPAPVKVWSSSRKFMWVAGFFKLISYEDKNFSFCMGVHMCLSVFPY